MPTKSDYEKMTVITLKSKLRKLNLDTTGRKVELINRLLENGEDDTTEEPKRRSTRTKVKKVEESSEEEEEEEEIDYTKFTVPKLKQMLKKQGLDTTGRKAELIERLKNGTDDMDEDGEEEEEEIPKAEKIQTGKRSRAQAKTTRTSSRKTKKIIEESSEEESSEEESSDEEPPKKRAASPKNVGKAEVDKYCQYAGRGAEVYADYDCMLNQGEKGANSCKMATSLDHAKTLFMKKFKDKTGNTWGEPFVVKKGKYTQIEMSYEEPEKMANKLATLSDEPTRTVITKTSTLDYPTQKFISLIFNEDMFKEQMIKFDLDVKKMPLGQLSKKQIKDGYTVLEKIKKALDAKQRNKLEDLTNEFYTKIPHSFGRTRPPLLSDAETVNNKMEMLAVLGDIEIAVSLSDNKKDKSKKVKNKKGEITYEKPNPLDEHYDSLHCDLTYVDTDSEEFELIQKYATNTSSAYRKTKIIGLWRVDREGSTDRFSQHDKLGNRKLLWHGTNIAVVAAILNSGLRIMPHSGGRVGRGIYFASENGKSSGYVSCSGKTGVMFLGEGVLGREHHIDTDDPSLRAAPPGYDSIVAQGKQEPDPSGDVEIEFNGKKVIVPTGKPIPQPKWRHSRFQNSEYLVYKESQAQLRYVMTVEFTR